MFETVCETCLNQSCSKKKVLLRRADSFDDACFLYSSLLCISKLKTVKRTLLQTDNFFSPQRKNSPALRGHKSKFQEFSKNRELNWKFLLIFLKIHIFLHFETAIFFLFHFAALKECVLLSRTLYIFSSLLFATNQSCFASLKTISDRDRQTILHPSMNYWFQQCDLN